MLFGLFTCFVFVSNVQVAICAGCNVYYPWGAFVVGVIAGVQCIMWMVIITKLRIDDPLDTFASKQCCVDWAAVRTGNGLK
jgi:ammonia channel protein AmtB